MLEHRQPCTIEVNKLLPVVNKDYESAFDAVQTFRQIPYMIFPS